MLLLAAIAGRPAAAQVDDAPWPTFGQNLQRTGQTPNAATTGSWRGNLAGGDATAPAIGPNGNVYLVDDDAASTFTLKKYDPTDGRILESTTLLTALPEGQPVVVGDSVVVTTISSGVASLKAFDGLLDSAFDVQLALSGVDSLSTPTIGNGETAYVMADASTAPDSLYAVDLSAGAVKWSRAVGDGSTVAPRSSRGMAQFSWPAATGLSAR